MKNLFLFCFLFLTGIAELAGQVPQVDVVYLKNRTLLKGKVVEVIPDQHIRIVLASDTMLIYLADIDSIRKEDMIIRVQRTSLIKYSFTTEINAGIGGLEGSDRTDPMSDIALAGLGVTNGISVTRHINLGIYTGVSFMRSRAFFPVCFDFRYNFLKKDITPYFNFRGGYSFGWIMGEEGEVGGATLGIDLGGRFNLGSEHGMFISAGYHLQELKMKPEENQSANSVRRAHFAILKIGYIL